MLTIEKETFYNSTKKTTLKICFSLLKISSILLFSTLLSFKCKTQTPHSTMICSHWDLICNYKICSWQVVVYCINDMMIQFDACAWEVLEYRKVPSHGGKAWRDVKLSTLNNEGQGTHGWLIGQSPCPFLSFYPSPFTFNQAWFLDFQGHWVQP